MIPLKNDLDIVDKSAYEKLFFSWEQILSFHLDFLEVLYQRVLNWKDTCTIGNLFIENVNIFIHGIQFIM